MINKCIWSGLKMIVVMVSCLFIFSNCYYDNQDDLYPGLNGTDCNLGTIGFDADVLPIMNLHCNTSGCHNSNDRGGNIVLDNYTDLITSANDGSLLGSMRFAAGFSAMPKGANKLDNCTIQVIENWINAGALNN